MSQTVATWTRRLALDDVADALGAEVDMRDRHRFLRDVRAVVVGLDGLDECRTGWILHKCTFTEVHGVGPGQHLDINRYPVPAPTRLLTGFQDDRLATDPCWLLIRIGDALVESGQLLLVEYPFVGLRRGGDCGGLQNRRDLGRRGRFTARRYRNYHYRGCDRQTRSRRQHAGTVLKPLETATALPIGETQPSSSLGVGGTGVGRVEQHTVHTGFFRTTDIHGLIVDEHDVRSGHAHALDHQIEGFAVRFVHTIGATIDHHFELTQDRHLLNPFGIMARRQIVGMDTHTDARCLRIVDEGHRAGAK